MPSLKKSPFRQLYDLAERCFDDLGADELRPQEVWFAEDPQDLERVQQALLRAIRGLETSLHRLAEIEDDFFASVPELDEWQAIEAEIPDWKKKVEILRPGADAEHFKFQLISIRTRVSELVDKLVVRSAVRDPYHRAANSLEAMKSIVFLVREKEQREIGLGLLEGPTWKETLEGSVADWSIGFGPQHRIELEQFCRRLLSCLQAVRPETRRSPQVAQLVTVADKFGSQLEQIYHQLLEVPANRVDAGVASDFHYMAGLVKKLVDEVTRRHHGILGDYAGRQLPAAVAGLLELLHLTVPKRRPVSVLSHSQPMTRKEIERQLGRRLVDLSQDQELPD
jgi:hypothetical protein